jgi:hypothetical protein
MVGTSCCSLLGRLPIEKGLTLKRHAAVSMVAGPPILSIDATAAQQQPRQQVIIGAGRKGPLDGARLASAARARKREVNRAQAPRDSQLFLPFSDVLGHLAPGDLDRPHCIEQRLL